LSKKIGQKNVEFKFCNSQKALPCVKSRHMSHRALKSIQSFSCRGRQEKKGRVGKVQKVTQALYFAYSWESPRERIFTKFCTLRDMPDIIICANFGLEKLRGLVTLTTVLRYRAACDYCRYQENLLKAPDSTNTQKF